MATPATTLASTAALFKRVYGGRPETLNNEAKRKVRGWKNLRVVDDLYGEGIHINYRTELPTGQAASMVRARANQQGSKNEKWFITRKKYYGFHSVDYETAKAASKDVGAFLRVQAKDVAEKRDSMLMSLGAAFWKSGSGSIGQCAALTSAANVTITFNSPASLQRIQKNAFLIANANETGGTNYDSMYQVTGLNRTAGTVTATRVAGTANWAANAHVFIDGDHGTAGELVTSLSSELITGWDAQIPAVAPTPGQTLFGMERGDDPEMKAGWRGTWMGTIEESIKKLCSDMGSWVEDGPTGIWLNDADWFRLEQELQGKNRCVMSDKATEHFGTAAILVTTPNGVIPCLADPFKPQGSAALRNDDSWTIHTMGGINQLMDEDGQSSVRLTTAGVTLDGLEMYWHTFLEAHCDKPFRNGRFEIPA